MVFSLSTWSHEGGQAVTCHVNIPDTFAALDDLLALARDNARGHDDGTPEEDRRDGITSEMGFDVIYWALKAHGTWEWYSETRETSFNITCHTLPLT